MTPATEPVPDDIEALRAAFAAERLARREAEVCPSGAEAMVAHLKLLDQLELQFEKLEVACAEDEAALGPNQDGPPRPRAIRRKPVRRPLPAHLPRERVVVPGPTACPCCQGKLAKLGEEVTETLEVVPRQWKVIQTVRERFTC